MRRLQHTFIRRCSLQFDIHTWTPLSRREYKYPLDALCSLTHHHIDRINQDNNPSIHSNQNHLNHTIKMQFSSIILSAVALFGSMTFAAPSEDLVARASCQIGDIWGAGDAACSASVCFLQWEVLELFTNRYTVPQGRNLPRWLLQRGEVGYFSILPTMHTNWVSSVCVCTY